MNSSKKTSSKRSKQYLLGIAQLYFFVSLIVPMLVPAGMMIGRNSDSHIVELLICSATNPRIVLFNLDTGGLVSPDRNLDSTERLAIDDESLTSGAAAGVVPAHSATDGEICPYDLATSDQLSIVAVTDSQAAKPATDVRWATNEFYFNQLEHPSSPPRGPPKVS